MTTRAKQLKDLISQLEVCAKGKNTIMQIIEIVSGEKLVEVVSPVYTVGQAFRCDAHGQGNTYILSNIEGRIAAVNRKTGYTASGSKLVKNQFAITRDEMTDIFSSSSFTLLTA